MSSPCILRVMFCTMINVKEMGWNMLALALNCLITTSFSNIIFTNYVFFIILLIEFLILFVFIF